MSKGGDTTTSTTSTALPAYAEPYVTDLLSRSQGVSNLPYTPYGAPRLADFSSDTQNSFDLVRNQANAGNPGLQQAMDATSGITGYQANTFNAQTLPGADLSGYMNPYTQNVLDVQTNRVNRAFGEQQATRDASAVAAGAFGGDRRFVADSLAQRDMNEQIQNIEATGLQNAYDRATGLFQSDANRSLSAGIASEEARRGGAGLRMSAASQLGGLAQTQQDMAFNAAEAMSGVGSRIQQRDQAGLDMGHQDFVNQRDYPAEQLQLYSQLLYGSPITPQSTTSVTKPSPSFLSQLAGLAVGGAGIWDLFN